MHRHARHVNDWARINMPVNDAPQHTIQDEGEQLKTSNTYHATYMLACSKSKASVASLDERRLPV